MNGHEQMTLAIIPTAEVREALAPRKHGVAATLCEVMADGAWRSLPELAAALRRRGVAALETSISARLRELPRSPYCLHVQARIRAQSRAWEYRVGVTSQRGAA